MFAKFARLAGLGAFGACGGILALYAGVVFITLPTRTTGIDPTSAAVVWIAGAGLTIALIVLHVVIGRQLLLLSDGPKRRQPL